MIRLMAAAPRVLKPALSRREEAAVYDIRREEGLWACSIDEDATLECWSVASLEPVHAGQVAAQGIG